MARTFALRPLRPGDLPDLLVVEHRATALLEATGIHPPGPAMEFADFEAFVARHTIVVATVGERPVGYAAGRDLGELYWLAELGVDPAFGRRGIGRALVRAMAGEAGHAFHRAIGLTTYRDVPFNAPFYERCGFVTVSHQALSGSLAERFEAEIPHGASAESRVAMVKWL